jgi:hypothetical protein
MQPAEAIARKELPAELFAVHRGNAKKRQDIFCLDRYDHLNTNG